MDMEFTLLEISTEIFYQERTPMLWQAGALSSCMREMVRGGSRTCSLSRLRDWNRLVQASSGPEGLAGPVPPEGATGSQRFLRAMTSLQT